MQKQLGKIGAIRREIRGKACSICGNHSYQLVLRSSCTFEESGLLARCSRCRHPKAVDDSFANVLWM